MAKSTESRLLAIERKVQRVIRKSIRNNETDYHVQMSVSSLEPGVVKYSLNIQNLDGTFAPITSVLTSLDDLELVAKELESKIDRDLLEKKFIQSRIDIFEKQLEGAKQSLADLEELGYEGLRERQTLEFNAKYKQAEEDEEVES